MSYILDALQKAERKRQRDSVPDLQTVHNPDPPNKRKGPLWAWLLGATLMICVVPLVLYLFERQGDNYLTAPVSGRIEKPAALQPVGEKNMKNTDSGDRELFPANATDAVDHMPESIPATKQPEIYEAPGTSNADIPAGHPSLVQDPSSPARPESLNQPGTIYEEKTSPAPADTGPSSPMPEPVAELTESDGEYTTAEMLVPEPPLKAENNPPLLTSLPQSLRQNIPELTISFHVFTQDPATRLVSINSRTVRQGQQVAPDLILEEITPAGVILSYKGNRFRMEVF